MAEGNGQDRLIRGNNDAGIYTGFEVSALVTAAYLILPSVRAWILREEPQPAFTQRDKDPGWRMLAVFAVLCLAMLALGCASGPVMNALGNLTCGTGGAV